VKTQRTTLHEVCELAAEFDAAFGRAAANPAARERLVELLWEAVADLHDMAAPHPFADVTSAAEGAAMSGINLAALEREVG
jgi:hypothetical protein